MGDREHARALAAEARQRAIQLSMVELLDEVEALET
jgi:hypothetical protein